MPSMVDHIADVRDNDGTELVRLAKLYPFPDFVKQASPDNSLSVPVGTPVSTCADPVRKQFWCHTKAACWLSHLFYYEKQAEFHPKERKRIEERLKAYATQWGIKTACDAIVTKWEELHKTAEAKLPDSAFAYVWVDDSGRKDRQYPLRSAMEVKAAAEWLHKYRDEVPFKTRHVMATKILTKAASFGAGINDHVEFLEKQAGRGVCDPDKVFNMIKNRAYLVPEGSELRTQFLKMANTVKDTPRSALQPNMLIKLAETMEQLDRGLDLIGKYSDVLPRPEDVIFEATFTKVSSEIAMHVETTSGNCYEKSAFRKLASEDVAALFGDEFVSRIQTPLGEIDPEKMAEEVGTLPRPDAQLLDSLLAENGIAPVMRKAAAVKQGLTEALMNQIARQYVSAG